MEIDLLHVGLKTAVGTGVVGTLVLGTAYLFGAEAVRRTKFETRQASEAFKYFISKLPKDPTVALQEFFPLRFSQSSHATAVTLPPYLCSSLTEGTFCIALCAKFMLKQNELLLMSALSGHKLRSHNTDDAGEEYLNCTTALSDNTH
eukprot:g48160.t1